MNRLKQRYVLIPLCFLLLLVAGCDIPDVAKIVLQRSYIVSRGVENALEFALKQEGIPPDVKANLELALEGVRAQKNALEVAMRLLKVPIPAAVEALERGESAVDLKKAIKDLDESVWAAKEKVD